MSACPESAWVPGGVGSLSAGPFTCLSSEAPSEVLDLISTFDNLNLKEDLLRGIYAYSWVSGSFHPSPEPFSVTDYEKPIAIQQRAIPPIAKRNYPG